MLLCADLLWASMYWTFDIATTDKLNAMIVAIIDMPNVVIANMRCTGMHAIFDILFL